MKHVNNDKHEDDDDENDINCEKIMVNIGMKTRMRGEDDR